MKKISKNLILDISKVSVVTMKKMTFTSGQTSTIIEVVVDGQKISVDEQEFKIIEKHLNIEEG